MRRDETILDGVVISAVIYDTDSRTISYEEDGAVVSTRPMTDAEWRDVTGVDPVVALATALLDAQSLEEVRQAAQAALNAAGGA